MSSTMPRYIREVILKLNSAGFKSYAVGGAVRDAVRKARPSDWDIATPAKSADVVKLFKKTVLTGEKYGTVTVFYKGSKTEVTTFRKDGEYPDGRRPEAVEYVNDIKEDLARRDFTMNAMAMGIDGEIIDPFDGRGDIEKKLIRCVGEPEKRFSEDALRMLRAVRFSAVLGFDIERETLEALVRCAPLAEGLSAERVRDEIEKILMSARPEMIKTALKLGLVSKFLQLQGTENETFTDELALLPKDSSLCWCAFAAGLKKSGYIEDTEVFLKNMRLPAKIFTLGGKAAGLGGNFPKEPTQMRAFIAKHGEELSLMTAAAAVVFGDKTAVKRVKAAIKAGGYIPVNGLKLNGRDLLAAGFYGAETGEALEYLSALASKGLVINEKSALLQAALDKLKKNR